MPERFRRDAGPPDFNEQVIVNSEQVSVGRGVPPSRRQNKKGSRHEQDQDDEAVQGTGRRRVRDNADARPYRGGGRGATALPGRLGGTPRPTFPAAKMVKCPKWLSRRLRRL